MNSKIIKAAKNVITKKDLRIETYPAEKLCGQIHYPPFQVRLLVENHLQIGDIYHIRFWEYVPYNTFMITNMNASPYQQIGELFEAFGSPVRIQILLAIGENEACVCHLESTLGLRQAYISQQLMDLREKGVITSRREGKFIYHRIEKPEFLDLIRVAARAMDIPDDGLTPKEHSICECPKCKQQG